MEEYHQKLNCWLGIRLFFCILEKFGDIKDNLNQQLYKEKLLSRPLAKEHLDLKLEIEKIVLENKHLEKQIVRNKHILEIWKTQNKCGIKRGTTSKQELRQYRHPPFSRLCLREVRMYKSQVLITTTLTSRSKVLPSS